LDGCVQSGPHYYLVDTTLAGHWSAVQTSLMRRLLSRYENVAPYAFLGNSGKVYKPWMPKAGVHLITATGYSASNVSGTAGKPLTVTINIVP
jgi:hypothetical protein